MGAKYVHPHCVVQVPTVAEPAHLHYTVQMMAAMALLVRLRAPKDFHTHSAPSPQHENVPQGMYFASTANSRGRIAIQTLYEYQRSLTRQTNTPASHRCWIPWYAQGASWNHRSLCAPDIAVVAAAFVNYNASIAPLTTSSRLGTSYLTSEDSCDMSLVEVGGEREGA